MMSYESTNARVKVHRMAIVLNKALRESANADLAYSFCEGLRAVLVESLQYCGHVDTVATDTQRILSAINGRCSLATIWPPLANVAGVILRWLLVDHNARRQMSHLVGASLEWIVEDERGG